MMQWHLLRGDILIGELSEYGCDQPFFLARFTPGPGWESVRALFEASGALRVRNVTFRPACHRSMV